MPNWTHEQLTSLGYHLHLDGSYHPNPPPKPISNPITKHDPVKPLVKPSQAQTKGKNRIDLCFERVSTKLQDFDNYVGGTKPLTDQLRYSGILPDDDPSTINATFTQTKCKKRIDEKTIIKITFHPKNSKTQNTRTTA